MYFFDLDGTILDSNGAWGDIDRAFLGRWGVNPVPADYTEFVTHHNFPEAAKYTRERYSIPMTEDEIMAAWRGMARTAYESQLPMKPGVRDFLERAKKAGIRCILLTSCMPELCGGALGGHGLTGYFEKVLTTVELGMEKRNPNLYHRVSGLYGEREENCFFFEDSPVNCAAARAAGWQVYGMPDPLFADRADDMRAACGPDRYPFSFLNPLPETVKKL